MALTHEQVRLPTYPGKRLAIYGRKLLSIVGVILLFLCLVTVKHLKRNQLPYVERDIYFSRHLLDNEGSESDRRCVELHDVNSSYRCQFVKETDDCQSEEGFIHYMRLPYCALPGVTILAFIILVLWLVFLFILVAVTADDYFCPALTVIADALNLSPSVAGVTFLAFGNGAPDIFSSMAGFVNSKSTGNLALSALIGAGVFITTIVAGAVSLTITYDLNQRPFVRDVLFNLGALAWTTVIVYREKIDLSQSIGFIVLYVVYALVVIIGRVTYQSYKRRFRNQARLYRQGFSSEVSNSKSTVKDEEDSTTSIPTISQGKIQNQDEKTPLMINLKRSQSSGAPNVLEELFSSSSSDFVDTGVLHKVLTIIKIPINFCLNLTVPVIELGEDGQNWSKWLQVVQCVGSPLFCVLALNGGAIMIAGKFPLAALIAIIGLGLAIIVAFTSQKDEPPTYHKAFGFFGFVASVVWIYSAANEIVNLLKVFGVAFKLSNEILGVTLLAWGNSVPDFFANVAVAKQGFPHMAIAACFGGPLLNLLLGVGLSCTIATSKNHGTLKILTGSKDYISVSFFALSLTSSAIVVPLLGFRMPKWYGVYLILMYIVFVILSVLNEVDDIFS